MNDYDNTVYAAESAMQEVADARMDLMRKFVSLSDAIDGEEKVQRERTERIKAMRGDLEAVRHDLLRFIEPQDKPMPARGDF